MTIDYSIYDQNLLGKAKKLATFEAIAAKRRLSYKQINIFELLAKVREYFGGWKEREAESCEFLSLDALLQSIDRFNKQNHKFYGKHK